MFKKVKAWFERRRLDSGREVPITRFSREQLENAYNAGYNDGKRDGLSIARQQATKSLKEILWEQNQQNQ